MALTGGAGEYTEVGPDGQKVTYSVEVSEEIIEVLVVDDVTKQRRI